MQRNIQSAPTLVYPESDGKPMAETDIHRDLMMDIIWSLQDHFMDDPVYVSGNLLIYYEEGDVTKSVAPDIFVVHGVEKKQRRTYLTWEEARTPDFVIELSSRGTYKNDFEWKKTLYASTLGVKEYYIYDPEGIIHPYFIGFQLIDGVYHEIDFVDSRLPSTVLGLELGERDGVLQFYDPVRMQWLQPPKERIETVKTHVEEEKNARIAAETRAKIAEAEVNRLLAELERIQQE